MCFELRFDVFFAELLADSGNDETVALLLFVVSLVFSASDLDLRIGKQFLQF